MRPSSEISSGLSTYQKELEARGAAHQVYSVIERFERSPMRIEDVRIELVDEDEQLMARPKSLVATTSHSLGSLIKSARDIMRKDKGLNGDLDRLPMLTWIMFLKFLDDLELQREGEAKLATKKFKPAIEPPLPLARLGRQVRRHHRRRTARLHQQRGNHPARRQKGAGLFRYLRTLTSSNGDDRRDVIATVFRGVQNRMVSGYLLRDVINKLNGIHFTSSDELHTLGALYESMLREMRDAGGRFRRVLHAARRRAVHGRRHRPAPRRNGARPGVRHGRLSRRSVQPPFQQAGQNRGRPQGLAGTEALRLRTQVAAVSALPDEPAPARPRRPAD